jgi:hypothetical protein
MTQQLTASNDVHEIADDELLARLHRLVRADHALTARLLVHMAEVDARGLYRERACPSMFEYCVEELHMSESEAYLRIQAARLGRRFPLVVELLAQGSLHLTVRSERGAVDPLERTANAASWPAGNAGQN